MKKLRIINLLTLVCLLFGTTAIAQDSLKTTTFINAGSTEEVDWGSKNPWSIGIHTFYSIPLNELDENCYRNGLALDIEVLTPNLLNSSVPFQFKLGGHLDYLGSGNEKAEAFTTLDGVEEPVDVTIRNSSVGIHLMGRLTTKEMPVRPYLDGIIGGRYLTSMQTSTLQNPNPDYETSNSEDVTSDMTFIFGGSLGCLVKVSRVTSLDFRVTYSHGSRADFVNLEEVTLSGNTLNTPVVENSKTEMLFFNVGVKLNLFGGNGSSSYGTSRRTNTGGGNVFYRPRTTNRRDSSCRPVSRPRKSWKTNTDTKPKKPEKPKPAN